MRPIWFWTLPELAIEGLGDGSAIGILLKDLEATMAIAEVIEVIEVAAEEITEVADVVAEEEEVDAFVIFHEGSGESNHHSA